MTPVSQFWQYVEEAMLDARHAKNEIEKRALLDLARTWTQAALKTEGTMNVLAGHAAKARATGGTLPVLPIPTKTVNAALATMTAGGQMRWNRLEQLGRLVWRPRDYQTVKPEGRSPGP